MDSWDFETSEIGIYSTDQLLKLLGVLDSDIRLSVVSTVIKPYHCLLVILVTAVNYMLSDTSIINEPPKMKTIPDFDLEINVTPQVINKFISGKSLTEKRNTSP